MRRVLIALVLVFVAASAFAQTAPPRITWLRYFQVNPGKGPEFMRLLQESSVPIFERLIAEKTIVNWGVVVPVTRNEETWTHAVFITLPNWAAADAMLNAVEAHDAKRPPEEMKRFTALVQETIRAEALRDVILRHLSLHETPPTVRPKFLGIDMYVVKPGRQGDAVGLFNEWAKPVFTELASKGRLGPWGFSTQQSLSTGWTHLAWYFLPDLGALDEMEAAAMALGPQKLLGYDVRLRDLSEPDKHRSQILRVVLSAP